MWTCINMQKISLFYWFVLEIWFSKKSCNLVAWEHFGLYLRNKNFPKYGICAGIYVFIITKTHKKLVPKSFNKFKKPWFLSIFSSLNWGMPQNKVWGKKIFPENLALSCTTTYGFLVSCQNSERTNDAIPRKHLDRRMDRKIEGQKNGQTLFYMTLLATNWGSKKLRYLLFLLSLQAFSLSFLYENQC